MSDYDPLDLHAQARAREESERQSQLDDEKFVQLMDSELGRWFVWGLLGRAGVYDGSFTPDALVMAFKAGQRNEGLRLLAQIHRLCPEKYQLMVFQSTSGMAERQVS
jgi:hypothetical protein